jgi:hypothetical protein
VIPKHHGEKLTDIPDDALMEILVRAPSRPNFAHSGRSRMQADQCDKQASCKETRQSNRGGELQRAAKQRADCASRGRSCAFPYGESAPIPPFALVHYGFCLRKGLMRGGRSQNRMRRRG